MSKKVTRLFEGFHPEHYEISLHPNRDTMRLSGTVTIHGKKVGISMGLLDDAEAVSECFCAHFRSTGRIKQNKVIDFLM